MQKEFTKADLKDGMVIEQNNKERYLVIGDRVLRFGGYNLLTQYNNDLTNVLDEIFQIEKVYKVKIKHQYCLEKIFDDENLELIWERTETKRLTAEEMRKKLEELTGEKIETEPSKEEMVGTIEIYCCNHGCHNCSIRKECDNKDAGFCKSNLEFIKQCYEKVMEDGRKES